MKPEPCTNQFMCDHSGVVDHGLLFGEEEKRQCAGHTDSLVFREASGSGIVREEWEFAFMGERDGLAFASAELGREVKRRGLAEARPLDPGRPTDGLAPWLLCASDEDLSVDSGWDEHLRREAVENTESPDASEDDERR